jgi:hypothetical protein
VNARRLAPIAAVVLLAGCGSSTSTTTTQTGPHRAGSGTPAELRAAYRAGYDTGVAMRTRLRRHDVLVRRCESKYDTAVGAEGAKAGSREAFNRGCVAGLASR